MMNFLYYRSANITIQITRSYKNNQYLLMNLSANFYVWQDFLPVRTEKNFYLADYSP